MRAIDPDETPDRKDLLRRIKEIDTADPTGTDKQFKQFRIIVTQKLQSVNPD